MVASASACFPLVKADLCSHPTMDPNNIVTNPTSLQPEKNMEANDETISLAEAQCEQVSACHRDELCDQHRAKSNKMEKDKINTLILENRTNPNSSKDISNRGCCDLSKFEAQNDEVNMKKPTPTCCACLMPDTRQDQAGTQQGYKTSKIEEEDVRRPVQVSDTEDSQSSQWTPSGRNYDDYGPGQQAQKAPFSMLFDLMNGFQRPPAIIDMHKDLKTYEHGTQTWYTATERHESCEVSVQVPEADSVQACLSAVLVRTEGSSVSDEAQDVGAVKIHHIAATPSPEVEATCKKHDNEDEANYDDEEPDVETFVLCEVMGDPENHHGETSSEICSKTKVLEHEPGDAEPLLSDKELLKPTVPADVAHPALPGEGQASEKQSHKDHPLQTVHDELLIDLQTTRPKEHTGKDCLETEEITSTVHLDLVQVYSKLPFDTDIPPGNDDQDCETKSLDLAKRTCSDLRSDIKHQSSRGETALHCDTSMVTEGSCSHKNDNYTKITTVETDENIAGHEARLKHLELRPGTKKDLIEVSKKDSILVKVDALVDTKGKADADVQNRRKLQDEDSSDWGRPAPELMLQPLFDLRRSKFQQLATFPLLGPSLSRDMAEEGARLRTFLTYPRASHHSALRLANAGFFYTGQDDTLRCYSCGVTFSYAEENLEESPYAVHSRLSSSCPHSRGLEQMNVFVQDEQSQALSALDITGQRAGQISQVPEVIHATRASLEDMRNQLAALGIILPSLFPISGQQQPGAIENQASLPPELGIQGPTGAAVLTSAASAPPLPGAQESTGEQSHRNAQEGEGAVLAVVRSSILESTAQQTETNLNTSQPPPEPPVLDVPEQDLRFLSVVPLRPGDLREPVASGEYAPERAVHRRYLSLAQREDSFALGWPDTHAQSPRSLALAGFFYADSVDCVRCHYCSLGLSHWDPEDLPLDEHVRWRSSCGFLHALLGEDLIVRILCRLSPHTPAPASQGLAGPRDRRGPSRPSTAGAVAHVASLDTARPAEPPTSVQHWMTSQAVRAAREMGFMDDVIRRAVQALLNTRAGPRAITQQNLVHAILYIRDRDTDNDRDEERNENEETVSDEDESSLSAEPVLPPMPPPGQGVSSESSAPAAEAAARGREGDQASASPAPRAGLPPTDPPRTARDLERENQELLERRRCKICLDNDVNILFLPCGHLVCCAECAAALRRCPICRRRIAGTVRTLMAPLGPTPPRGGDDLDENPEGGNRDARNNRDGSDANSNN